MIIELSNEKTRSFEFRLTADAFKSYGDEFEGRPDQDGLLVQGRINRLNTQSVELNFSVKGTMLYPCARCLKPTPVAVDFDFEDTIPVEAGSDTIDLVPFVEECLFINEPFRVLCSEECKGLCPGCGVNLNCEACQCDDTMDIDPRLEALKKLL